MLTSPSFQRGGIPCGVYKRANGRYFIVYGGKTSFRTLDEAHKEYLKRRKIAITDAANRFFNDGLIEEKVYNALLNFKIT